EHVAQKSDKARTWAQEAFKNEEAQPFFAGTPGPDIMDDLFSRDLGLVSIHAVAAEEINDALSSGKLVARGIDPATGQAIDIKPNDWVHVDISIDGQATINHRLAWRSVHIDARQLKRIFPRATGRRGTKRAEIECAVWIKDLSAVPRRIKSNVWNEANKKW